MASSNYTADRWWLAVMLFALACIEVWFGRSVCVLCIPVQFSRLMWRGDAVGAWPWCWWLFSGTSDLHRWDWVLCPLSAEAAICYVSVKVPLTGFLVNLPIRKQHWCGTFVFLCATSLEAWDSLWLYSFPEPMPVFQLTCSRWAAQWGGHWQRQMCLFTGDKTLLWCRWQRPGVHGALWHCCHTTLISTLQAEPFSSNHST